MGMRNAEVGIEKNLEVGIEKKLEVGMRPSTSSDEAKSEIKDKKANNESSGGFDILRFAFPWLCSALLSQVRHSSPWGRG